MSDQTVTLVSPYGAAKIVNEWLKEDGVQRTLPPQMFYQYTSPKKAYIRVTLSEDGKRCVTTEDLRAWYDEKYRPTRKSREAVVADEDGTVG